MSKTKFLRPHHALCIRFFEGKGYSEDFVRHMHGIIALLEQENPTVTLHDGCDCICEGCPKNTDGVCADNEKVRAIDKRAFDLLQYSAGDDVYWSDLYEKANEEIIGCGRLKEVCRDCQWLCICEK